MMTYIVIPSPTLTLALQEMDFTLQTAFQIIAYLVIIFLFSVAIFTDFKERKIKNRLTLPTALIAFVIGLFLFPLLTLIVYTLILFLIGIIGWMLNMWKAGDMKLILATGLWATFLFHQPILLFSLFYYLIFIVLHLVIGHLYGLKKYRFNLKKYLLSLKTEVNEVYGRFVGSLTILVSFISTYYLIIQF